MLFVAILVSACAPRAGVAEFQLYANSFDDVVKAAEPLIAETRRAEKTFELGRIDAGQMVSGVATTQVGITGIPDEFRAAHAEIIAESSDPPYTAAIRSSLEVLSRYNATLLKFAEGAALQPILTEADRLRSEASLAYVAISGSQMAVMPAAEAALAGLNELARLGIRAGSREVFRSQLIAHEPAMQRLLDVLIASTETTYELIIRENQRRARRLTGDALRAEQEKADAKRSMMAEWVVVMRRSKVLLSRTVEVATSDSGLLTTLSASADLAGEIRLSAQRIRGLAAAAN